MTLKEFLRKNRAKIDKAIRDALKEDNANSDVTTALLSRKTDRKITAKLICKENCTLAGIEVFKRVYRIMHGKSAFRQYLRDGNHARKGQVVLEVRAPLKIILAGERTALNFLQRMSGIATLTRKFAVELKYPGSKILHTRKTTPNFRVFEMAAVKTGGGDFHRDSLKSSVLIKDNHIIAAGSVQVILKEARRKRISQGSRKKFEVEVRNLKELEEAVRFGKGLVKVVMLDNFSPKKIGLAVKMAKENGMKIEVSGGLKLRNFKAFQRRGIDFYSSGTLTHSYKSVDFSLEF